MNYNQIVYQARLELARRDFWEFCKLTAPDFYAEDRLYLKDLCRQLQHFIESDEKVIVINMPPRHGKSRTATLLVEWIFGINPKLKVMTGSYNETLSTTFAKQVRDTIWEEKSEGILSYCDIFPGTKIKYGESSAAKWALQGSSQTSYLATSPKGTATGFGCNIMIIDDLIKSSAEAFNENILLQHQDWFNNTMLSRTENGFKLIIIMTRWATNDLAGYILNQYQGVRHINYKALQDDGTMLCDSVLNAADFTFKTRAMAKEIISANYQQEPMDIKGRLYTQFKTYSQKPDFKYLLNYTDTADTGEDYLCSINYGVTFDGDYYILDVLYTKEPMEVTEPLTAKMLTKDNIGCALIESNNGGRGFARNVQRELKDLGNAHTNIQWFHQTQNKQARIFSNSASVMAKVYYPENWLDKFPEFADSLLRYQKEGKNAHDDAPDALTGVYENNKPKGGWLY
jgi:predicted phage terminase large subunit-like protein